MKQPAANFRASSTCTILVLGVWILGFGASAASLEVEIVPRFNGARLAFDSLNNTNAERQRISVTRLDFLLSDLAFGRVDGSWAAHTTWVAYVSTRERRTRFQLDNLPAGDYQKLRFHIGLQPEINRRDPAQYPAKHPLNPEVNGLHWGWMGGYVFLALEGQWTDKQTDPSLPSPSLPNFDLRGTKFCGASGGVSDFSSSSSDEERGGRGGYSYHLATDRHLMTVELPLNLEFATDAKLQLALNVDQIFTAPNQIILSEATTSTHSRTNDSLAMQLRQNVERAFSIERIASTQIAKTPAPHARHIEIAPNAIPYRLSISSFFPRPVLPMDNPLTEEGVELGRRLFFEPKLSINNSQSCASCHPPAFAFSDNKPISAGAEGKTGTRNAMPLFNLAWKSAFFWDGRAASLREQVIQPIQNAIEMHESLSNVVVKLGEPVATYPALFARAFGTSQITPDRIARALEQFLLTQTSHDSKFDRVLKGQAQFTTMEQRGFELFHTEYDPRHEQFGADCFHCHGGPAFQSQAFANNGLDAEPRDFGRSLVTGKQGDKGKFAVPSLRNSELTGPYMHDGRFQSLEEVVEHYSTGVKRSATLDPNLAKHPDGGVPLSSEDKNALIAFLKTLTDERYLATPNAFAKTP